MSQQTHGRSRRRSLLSRSSNGNLVHAEPLEARLLLSAPYVTQVWPYNDGDIAVDFDQSMDAGNVNNSYDIWVTDSNGNEVSGSISWSYSDQRITWESDYWPAQDDTWTVHLAGQDSSDFINLYGEILDGNADGYEGGNFVQSWAVAGQTVVPQVTAFQGYDDGSVTVNFSTEMNADNVDNSYDIWVADSQGYEVPGQIQWNSDNTQITWWSNDLPQASDTWTINLAANDSSDFVDMNWTLLDGDNDGVAGGDYSNSWSVVNATALPAVTKLQPYTDGSVDITFNTRMDAANVNNYYDAWVQDSAGWLVDGSIAWSQNDTVLSWYPDQAPLSADTWTIYLISDDQGFRDTMGRWLDGNNNGIEGGDYVSSWDVSPLVQVPTVASFQGHDNGSATVAFSAAMDAQNVDNYYDVYVVDSKGNSVAGDISWSSDAKTMTWSAGSMPGADDNWTITLKAQDYTDFVDTAGTLLDGDANGTPGGDYVDAWHVSGTSVIPADAYEENDTISDAPLLEVGTETVQITGLTMDHDDDDDWYAFNTTTTGSASDRVFIDFDNSQGDLDLAIYDTKGNPIVWSISSTDNEESVSLDGLAAGTWYIRVYGKANPHYTLTIQPPQAVSTGWTLMYYVDGDNNLDPYFYQDLDSMESLNLPSDVKVVVLYDRAPGADSGITDDWSDTRRGVLSHNPADGKIESVLTSVGELDMGDPQNLSNFITWAKTNYPSQHYMLSIADHGGGVLGSCWDDSSSSDNLTPPEISSALATAGVHFDIIKFNACLNGMVEIASAVAPYGDYMVGSEEVSFTGLMTPRLQAFVTLSDRPAGEIATEMARVSAAGTTGAHDLEGQTFYTCESAINLNQVGALNSALAAFVQAVHTSATPSDWTHIANAANSATHFYYATNKDLGRFLMGVRADTVITQAIRDAARDALTSLGSAVTANYSNGSNTEGLSIMLTTSAPANYATLAAPFVAATGWDQFLHDLAAGGTVQATGGDWAEPNNDRTAAYHLAPPQGQGATLTSLNIGSPSDVRLVRAGFYIRRQCQFGSIYPEHRFRPGLVAGPLRQGGRPAGDFRHGGKFGRIRQSLGPVGRAVLHQSLGRLLRPDGRLQAGHLHANGGAGRRLGRQQPYARHRLWPGHRPRPDRSLHRAGGRRTKRLFLGRFHQHHRRRRWLRAGAEPGRGIAAGRV